MGVGAEGLLGQVDKDRERKPGRDRRSCPPRRGNRAESHVGSTHGISALSPGTPQHLHIAYLAHRLRGDQSHGRFQRASRC